MPVTVFRPLILNMMALGYLIVATPTGAAPLDVKAAEALWSMRAALNVAALQCQFDPSFNIVDNYKHFLQDHSVLLKQAQSVMSSVKKQNFDHYTTELYNSFSSVNEQMPFCTKAAQVGNDVSQMKDEELPQMAMTTMPEIRAIFPAPPVQVATKSKAKSKRKSRRRT